MKPANYMENICISRDLRLDAKNVNWRC